MMPRMLDRLVLGDTLNYVTTVDGYPASEGWTLNYRLVPRGAGTAIDFSCSADGDDHRAQVTAAVTATWGSGVYSWHSWVSKATEKYTVATGSVTLIADPRTTANGLDLRSNAQTALDAVRALLQGKATSGQSSYRIGERELRSYSMGELLELESKLSQDVRREEDAARIAAGLPSQRRVLVRLARA